MDKSYKIVKVTEIYKVMNYIELLPSVVSDTKAPTLKKWQEITVVGLNAF